MPRFSIEFQQAHDIDWFAQQGLICIHAMSFGGPLPKAVNDRDLNTKILLAAYSIKPYIDDVTINDGYVNERLKSQDDSRSMEERRERYLRHFKEMAQRGFWSFDRDLNDEKRYHLIARPTNDNGILYCHLPKMPRLGEECYKPEGDDLILDFNEEKG